jgi:methionyl aminopeptidase
MVIIKTQEEIQKMRVAGELTARALNYITPYVKPGITTNEINDLAHNYIVDELNSYPASLGYRDFPKSLCTSVNNVICHGIPGDKKLKKGDIVNVDIVVKKDGFHGDSSKMFCVGDCSILANRLIKVTQECLYLGIKMIKPGVKLGNIGYDISKHAHANGFSVVREYCGHGVGASMHEEPSVLHYGEPGTGYEIEPGMIFTIEPMINAGKRAVRLLPDQWTVVTKDRSLSAQWEHTILVTETGYDILTYREEEQDKIAKVG